MKKRTEIIFRFLPSHKIDALRADFIKLKKTVKINTDRAVYCTSASSKAQKIKNSSKTVGWKVRRLREE